MDNNNVPQGPVFDTNDPRDNPVITWIQEHKLVSFILVLALISLIWLNNGGGNRNVQYTYERIEGKLVKVEVTPTPESTPQQVIVITVGPNDNPTFVVRRAITQYVNDHPEQEITIGKRLYTETIHAPTLPDPLTTETVSIPLTTIESHFADYNALTQFQKNTWQRNARYVAF